MLSLLYTTAVNLPAVIAENRSWMKQYLTDFLFVVICWTIAREIIIFTRKIYPGVQNTRLRVALLFVSTVVISFAEGFLIVYLLNYTNYYEISFTLTDFFYTSGLILVFSMLIMAIYESLYSLGAWNKLAVEAEALKRENLQSQLDSLKEQVKPHFLFNSLSTLIGLIDEDKNRAKKFVEELAYVYRYLLQSSEKELISLADELIFIKAYYYLLKTRFDDRLILDIYVGKEISQMLIPPLTFQILLENAVKHNTVSPEKPLHIVIAEKESNKVEITNTLQRRNQSVISTQTGLANLAAKYQLLQQPTPEIIVTDEKFSVQITLIPNPVS
jgi:two-component system, LytTR family, sensor kinase